MGYLLLLLATLAWSFVGILVKTSSVMVDSAVITFARFFIGVLFLLIYIYKKEGKFSLKFGLMWIWIGAAAKAINYICENIAISIGYSYGNILVQPVQTVILMVAAALVFKEKITARGWFAALLCIIGVCIIGWNGLPLHELLSGGGLTTILFVIAGSGAAIHVLSQRMLVNKMDSGNMNASIFIVSTGIVLLPMPVQSEGFVGPMSTWAWIALVLLGFITAFSFMWSAEAIKRVPFALVALSGNITVIFTIVWSYIFFKDPITMYVIIGTLTFIIGLLILNLPAFSRVKRVQV